MNNKYNKYSIILKYKAGVQRKEYKECYNES